MVCRENTGKGGRIVRRRLYATPRLRFKPARCVWGYVPGNTPASLAVRAHVTEDAFALLHERQRSSSFYALLANFRCCTTER